MQRRRKLTPEEVAATLRALPERDGLVEDARVLDHRVVVCWWGSERPHAGVRVSHDGACTTVELIEVGRPVPLRLPILPRPPGCCLTETVRGAIDWMLAREAQERPWKAADAAEGDSAGDPASPAGEGPDGLAGREGGAG